MEDDKLTSNNYVWVPDPVEVFARGSIIDYLPDGNVRVAISNGVQQITRELAQKNVEKCNPEKFNKCDDMAELTHLNEPSVINNLFLRYNDDLIYTYSGLFLVAINPYKKLSTYENSVLKMFHELFSNDEKRLPPHIFAIAEKSHRNLTANGKDQSILVTGESGAGKTENTKRIIQYLSLISLPPETVSSQTEFYGIHDNILRANPILESFGNAKTIKNNNSSRFGKFIKVFFNMKGFLSGATIDYYLLEKSRVTHQSQAERNYHVFYQFLKGMTEEQLSSRYHLVKNYTNYNYLSQSAGLVSSIDDKRDFHYLNESFRVMGFSETEVESIFRGLAVILHLGNVDFNSWKADQASFAKNSNLDVIAGLLGVNTDELSQNLLTPKVKAGREFVRKSQNASEVKSSIDGFAKHLYEKVFQFIFDKINASLMADEISIGNFIGVLDIAGFEIFEINSLEQLCINYTNEKLQQFFNHHSFVLEQSEYIHEDIQWEYIDFGLDLQPTINLIETKSPMGILEILSEQCVLPKSSEETFMDKLFETWSGGRVREFRASNSRSGFVIDHYAGSVEYDVADWLQKNRDPVSESLTTLMAHSKNTLIGHLFSLSPNVETLKKRKPVSIQLKTVCQRHKEQLSNLMNELTRTEPHFVRCILPNQNKKSNKFDKELVLYQLRCNGVLEGIRISRAGYPNKMNFEDFFKRYSILNKADDFTKHLKSNCELILKHSMLNPESFKIGISKLFFKNGFLGLFEELRDTTIQRHLTCYQSLARGGLTRRSMKKQIAISRASRVVARNFNTINLFVNKAEDPWLKLYLKIKPLLENFAKVSDAKYLNDNLKDISAKLKETEAINDGLQLQNIELNERLRALEDELVNASGIIESNQRKFEEIEKEERKKRLDFEQTVKQLCKAEEASATIAKSKSAIFNKLKESEKVIDEMKSKTKILEADKKTHLLNINSLGLKLEEHAVQDRVQQDRKHSIYLLEGHCNDSKSATERLDVKTLELKEKEAELQEARLIFDHNVSALAKLEKSLCEMERKNDELVKNNVFLETRATITIKALEGDKLHLEKDVEILSSANTVLGKSVITLKQQLQQYGEDPLERNQEEVNAIVDEMNEARAKVANLEQRISEMDQILNAEHKTKKSMEKKLDELTKKLNAVGDVDQRRKFERQQNEEMISVLKQSRDELSRRVKAQEPSLALYARDNTKIRLVSRTNNEYSLQFLSLHDDVQDLHTKLELQENLWLKSRSPSLNILNDYTTINARFGEQSAVSRTERLEKQKLLDDVQIIRKKFSDAFESPPKRSVASRPLAMGDEVRLSQMSESRFAEKVRELEMQLKQEGHNALRAERYAIELQKRLNKVQATRGINTFFDFEKKYKDAQSRVEELENKIADILSDFSNYAPDNIRQVMSHGNILGSVDRQSSIDFAKIYSDINNTLRATRDELGKSKSEILRLKSLLRESEDELYDIKKNHVKSTVSNYEQELARLTIDKGNMAEKYKETQRSLLKFKSRSEEYYEKLELADSAVTISKRLEVLARTDVEEKTTELKLAKEEVRVSEKIIKQLSHTIYEIEEKRDTLLSECKRSQNQINLLQEKINYFNKNYSDRENSIEEYKDEIKALRADVKFRLEKESEMIRENKRFKLDNNELLRIKKKLSAESTEVLKENETLIKSNEALQINVSHLQSDKEIHERQIVQCGKQIESFRGLLEENGTHIMGLTSRNQELEHDKAFFENKISTLVEELANTGRNLGILQEHSESMKTGNLELQKEAEHLRRKCEAGDVEYKEARNENLAVVQANESLKMVNCQLAQKVGDLESKLYSNKKLEFSESNASRLIGEIDILQQKILNGEVRESNLRKKVSALEYDNERRGTQLKKYNDENFNYQNMIGQYKGKVEYLYQDNSEKDSMIKAQERALASLRDKCILEKE